jgi:hypothetical protein
MPAYTRSSTKATPAAAPAVAPTNSRKRQGSGADQDAKKRLRSGSKRAANTDLEQEGEQGEKEEEGEKEGEGEQEEEGEQEGGEGEGEEAGGEQEEDEAGLPELEEEMVVDKLGKGKKRGRNTTLKKEEVKK